ncbi:putative host specificity J domain protein [Escherichia coli 1-110-08_S4_C1]|nr:putative host specificity J domain protein [Escherichia coli 1-110-08_S4_C1]
MSYDAGVFCVSMVVNGWYPTASISDLLVVVMKKATAGISIS